MLKRLFFVLCFMVGVAFPLAAQAEANPTAYVLTVKGGIGPATAMYLEKGLSQAQADQAAVVIIKLDTPGGLVKSTREIIQSMLASSIPVVVYVAPSGAHAASAGTFLLYAGSIAAMAPGTNLGAATPISLGGMPGGDQKKSQEDTGMKKAKKDAAAYIKSLAELHGRNVKWAEQAVSEAETLTAQQALKNKVINVIAPNLTSLLEQINGEVVKVAGGKTKLDTKKLAIKAIHPDFRERVLNIIASPTVAYVLLLVGIYGIFFELMSPGMIVPGVVGVLSLLVAVYGLHLLPINLVGMALLLSGIVLMILELFITSFGLLAIGGVVAFFVGSLFLFDRNLPGYDITVSVAVALTLVTAVFFLLIVRLAVRSQRRPIVSGSEELAHSEGVVVNAKTGELTIRIQGELWQASSEAPLQPGQKVKVIKREGLTLIVEPQPMKE